MSNEENLIDRPKVRFCQPSESASKCELSESTNVEAVPQCTSRNKPCIRSIVTLDNSSKLEYKNGNFVALARSTTENKGSQNSDSEPMRNIASSSETSVRRSPLSLYNEQTVAKNKKLSTCETNCQRGSSNVVTRNQKSSIASKAQSQRGNARNNSRSGSMACANKSNENFVPTDSCGSGIVSQAKNGGIAKPKSCVSKIASRHATAKAVPTAKKPLKKSAIGSNEAVVSHTNTTCKNNMTKTYCQKEKTPDKSSLCFGRVVASPAETVTCGSKMSKPVNKTLQTCGKIIPVKKTLLRDVNACSTNVYVGPGIARYYPQLFKGPLGKEGAHIRPNIVSGEKLNRPEYNSIMCTIEELKRVQSEKLVTDVEHLPLVYKNLVNEKVSAALDFPPDETIYKNLVDLSVSDNHLPSRLTRSKDPEPRHKDVVPELSDFFTPSYSQEYCSAVEVRPSSPEISSNWSAFVISDKIFGWKHDMDQSN